MANYALGNIRHGEGSDVTSFSPGDKVEGLPKDVLKLLEEQGMVASRNKARLLRPELFDEEEEETPASTPTPDKAPQKPSGGASG
jgi:hypothetical protein